MENHLVFLSPSENSESAEIQKLLSMQYCLCFPVGSVPRALVSIWNSGPGFLVTLQHL